MPSFLLILACALWGLSFPVVKALQLEQASRLGGASDEFLTAWIQLARFSLAALLLAPFLARCPRPTAGEIRQALWLALWGGIGMGFQTWGLGHTSASTSAFLTQAYCVILPLIACARTRRAPGLRVVGATLLVITGGAVLSGLSPGDLALGPGEQATLLAAFFFTFQILTLEAPVFAANRGLPVTFVMCLAIAVLFLPITWFTAPEPAAILAAGSSIPAALLILILTVFSSIGAYLLMNTWQRRVTATEAGLIYTSEPVFAAAYALFLPSVLSRLTGTNYPDESLTATLLIGGGLILAANVWMQWKRPPHAPALAPSP